MVANDRPRGRTNRELADLLRRGRSQIDSSAIAETIGRPQPEAAVPSGGEPAARTAVPVVTAVFDRE
ncbi:hypothetical protein [Umezawaea beigongshangensis]|uniref:hypothetical protein n=1 Tax=Umezawaea beigongshangensis TaxID=2780383 RepID=UPI0018F10F0C|nr:hypothetical protein [Umezawaea beigongshangensis]